MYRVSVTSVEDDPTVWTLRGHQADSGHTCHQQYVSHQLNVVVNEANDILHVTTLEAALQQHLIDVYFENI